MQLFNVSSWVITVVVYVIFHWKDHTYKKIGDFICNMIYVSKITYSIRSQDNHHCISDRIHTHTTAELYNPMFGYFQDISHIQN